MSGKIAHTFFRRRAQREHPHERLLLQSRCSSDRRGVLFTKVGICGSRDESGRGLLSLKNYRLIFRSRDAPVIADRTMAAVTRSPAAGIANNRIERISFRRVVGESRSQKNEMLARAVAVKHLRRIGGYMPATDRASIEEVPPDTRVQGRILPCSSTFVLRRIPAVNSGMHLPRSLFAINACRPSSPWGSTKHCKWCSQPRPYFISTGFRAGSFIHRRFDVLGHQARRLPRV